MTRSRLVQFRTAWTLLWLLMCAFAVVLLSGAFARLFPFSDRASILLLTLACLVTAFKSSQSAIALRIDLASARSLNHYSFRSTASHSLSKPIHYATAELAFVGLLKHVARARDSRVRQALRYRRIESTIRALSAILLMALVAISSLSASGATAQSWYPNTVLAVSVASLALVSVGVLFDFSARALIARQACVELERLLGDINMARTGLSSRPQSEQWALFDDFVTRFQLFMILQRSDLATPTRARESA